TEALSRAVFLPRLATISNLVVPGAVVTLLPPILSTFSPLRVISLASLVSHLTVTASPAVTSFRETVSLAVGVAQAPNKTATRTIARPEIECLILRVIYPPFLICVVRYFKIKKTTPHVIGTTTERGRRRESTGEVRCRLCASPRSPSDRCDSIETLYDGCQATRQAVRSGLRASVSGFVWKPRRQCRCCKLRLYLHPR